MAINIKFDLTGNPEPPAIILANRNGNRLGQLKVNENSIDLSDKLNDASEFSFTVNKYIDNELTPLWDKLVDFKLVYCKEWNTWFEIKVELDEATEAVKTVFCTQLGQAELSQIMLYNIEINTEKDIERDDYKISILYDWNDPRASILDRTLEKAPHYSIAHVDNTIKDIQRSFSFDGTSIYDSHQEIAKEIGCLFKYDSNSDENGKIQRTISVYDLQQNCKSCGHRGDFTDICPECGSTNIKYGYGEDTTIFVTSDELASEGIQLVTDTNSVKNCFKLEAGDDLMTSTVRNCNPNGTDYIWRFSDDNKEDMSENLKEKLEAYNEMCLYYQDDYVYNEILLSENMAKTFVVGRDLEIGNVVKFICKSMFPQSDSVTYETVSGRGNIFLREHYPNGYVGCEFTIEENIKTISVKDNINVYLLINDKIAKYNNLVSKYKEYNDDLQYISPDIKGHSSLMNAHYNTIDLSLYLESGLMPSVEMRETNAEEQAEKLTPSSLSPVAVADVTVASLATLNSAVLAMAKIIVDSTYKIQVDTSEIIDGGNTRSWRGNFIITNYSDDEDSIVSEFISVEINDDIETFVKQKIDKALNKEDTDDFSISGLLKKDYGDFCNELKKYALNPLISFRDACQSCIDILIEQGVGSDATWSETGSESDLYNNLYTPYYNKLMAIESEIKVREDEISIISGVYDVDGNLIYGGLQTYIEECRNQIQKILNFENYLGNELWLEFCAFRREDKYSNDNYISDGLNNTELFEKALEFFKVAENEIYKSSELQYSISTTLNNLLNIPKFKSLVKYFKVGNWIRVQVDDKIYKLRLLEYNINFENFDNISVEFSDVIKIKNGVTDVQDILSQASSMATSYSYVQRQASQGNEVKNTVEQWISQGLNSAMIQIQNNDSEDITLTKNGLLCRSYDDVTDTYSPEQFRLTHNIMAYTTDNWKTVSAALGKHDYVYYDSDKTKQTGTDYGLTAKFVTAGNINGSQIIGGEIFSDNYTSTTGTYLDLRNGNFSWAGGKIIYDGDTVTLDGVTIQWQNTNDVPMESVSGLDQAIEDLEDYTKQMEQSAKDYADAQDVTLKTDLTTAYETYTNSKVSQLDTAVGTYLGLNGSTLIGGNYVISPYIGGGYLNITNTNNSSRVIIDPNNLTGNNYIFQVHNGTKVSMGITTDGSAFFEGKIITKKGSEIAGWIIDSSRICKETDDFCVFLHSPTTISEDGGDGDVLIVKNKQTNTYPFILKSSGKLTTNNAVMNNAIVDGQITASGGSIIGNLTISGSLTHTSGNNTVTLRGVQPDKSYGVFYITDKSSGSDVYPFRVNGDGSFTATKATIDGDSTFGGSLDAVSGSFTSLTAGQSSFNSTYINIAAKVKNSQGQYIDGYIRIGAPDYSNWEDITIRPSHDNCGNIGTPSHRWDMLYVKNGAVQSSDRNYKTDISTMGKKQEQLFDLLSPVTFKFIDSSYDRYHYGFISQEVEDAIHKCGLTTKDFAGFCKDVKRDGNGEPVLDENGNPVYIYSLRYNEFIALNTHMIQKVQAENQKLKERVDSLEDMIKQLS